MKTVRAVLLLLAVAACSDATNPVVPPPPPPFTAHVAYCAGNEPRWVAFQDGSGAWTQALPEASNGRVVFTHTFLSDRGAIATAFEPGGGFTGLVLLYGTPQELETRGVTNPRFCSAGTNTLQGSVAGLSGNDFAAVWGGFFVQSVVLDNVNFALDRVAPGPRDFLATRVTRVPDGDSVAGIILRRGVDLPNGATLPVFDFTSAEAFQPDARQLSLGGRDLTGAVVATRFITRSLDLPLSLTVTQHAGTTVPYPSIPESRLLPGDLQVVQAQTHASNNLLVATLYYRTPLDRALDVGAPMIPPQLSTVATLPTLRVRARFLPQGEYNQQTSISYQQDQTIVGIAMTAAYAGLTGGYDMQIPELSGVANFNSAWALHGPVELRWTASRIGGTLGLGIDAIPVDGTVQRSASTIDVFTP